ncbi:hypothetical protein F5Y16DRAFT_396160 [Xylariaceae sp. FL0255]|nr:hypothetical protein F5Y16DRAFT_396160 [Xylariaceae sp. FL0255]
MDYLGEALALELVISIAVHLNIDDIARCLRVSRAWRFKFLSDDLYRIYGPIRLPNVIGMNSGIQEAITQLGQTRFRFADLFDPERRELGSSIDMTYKPPPYRRVPPRVFRQPRANGYLGYAYGTVFWNPAGHALSIDKLTPLTPIARQKYLVPMIRRWEPLLSYGMGSKFFVTYDPDRNALALDHTTGQWYKKVLNNPNRASPKNGIGTVADMVMLFLHNRSAIMLWKPEEDTIVQVVFPGGPLPTRLRFKDLIGARSGAVQPSWLQARLHPDEHNKDTFFLVAACGDYNGQRMTNYTVHEFKLGDHISSWTLHRPFGRDPRLSQWTYQYYSESYEFEQSYIICGMALRHRTRYFRKGTIVDVVLFDKNKREWLEQTSVAEAMHKIPFWSPVHTDHTFDMNFGVTQVAGGYYYNDNAWFDFLPEVAADSGARFKECTGKWDHRRLDNKLRC